MENLENKETVERSTASETATAPETPTATPEVAQLTVKSEYDNYSLLCYLAIFTSLVALSHDLEPFHMNLGKITRIRWCVGWIPEWLQIIIDIVIYPIIWLKLASIAKRMKVNAVAFKAFAGIEIVYGLLLLCLGEDSILVSLLALIGLALYFVAGIQAFRGFSKSVGLVMMLTPVVVFFVSILVGVIFEAEWLVYILFFIYEFYTLRVIASFFSSDKPLPAEE